MSRSAIPRPMPRDAPVTIATFVLTGESRPGDVGRPSIVCTESILLSFARRSFRNSSASLTIVVQHARRRRALDAGDGAQIFIDRSNVPLRHVLERRPWHDLCSKSPSNGGGKQFVV